MPRFTGSLARSSGGGIAAGVRTLVVLVCVSLVTLTLYLREGPTGPVHTLRSAVQTVASPFQWVGAQIERPFEALGTRLSDSVADLETLSQLEEQNETLLAQLAELNEYKSENERLRSMLDLNTAYGLNGVAARVVGTSSDDWSNTVTVDKGSDAGVALDMPVTDGKGVVGQVSSVSSNSSVVTLLSDPSYQCSALLQNSRAVGVLTGSVDGSLHLEYVPVSQDVAVGELVVTSGLGGTYPKGLLLGAVASVTSSPSDVYYTIVVEPVARVGNYEEVCIVVSFDSQRAQEASETLLATGSFVAVDEVAVDPSGDGGALDADGGAL